MQIIITTDLEGKITEFYYQRISSTEAKSFQDKNFTNKFIGLRLKDFSEKASQISDPSKASPEDFRVTLRGIKKNLILLDEFLSHEKKGGK